MDWKTERTGGGPRAPTGIARRAAFAGIAVTITGIASGEPPTPFFVPVPIADCWLERSGCVQCGGITLGDTYPTGQAIYAGVPFVHGSDACYGFTGYYHPGSEWTMTLALPRARAVHLLLSTWNWADCAEEPNILVALASDADEHITFALRNGEDIRDHNPSFRCDLINGSGTVEVWSNGYGQVMDKIRLEVGALPNLQTITLSDPPGIGRWPILFGVTVEFDEDCNADGVVDYGQILEGTMPDADGNGIPDCCESPADLDRDGSVGPQDLALILGNWGPANPKTASFDLDGDGNIDGNDLSIVLAAWGACP